MGENKTIAPAAVTAALMNAIAKRWSFAEAMYWLTIAAVDDFTAGLLPPFDALSSNYAKWGLQNDGTVAKPAQVSAANPTSTAVQSAMPDCSTAIPLPLLVWMRAQIAGGVPLRRQVLTAFAEWRVRYSRYSFALMQNDVWIGGQRGANSSASVRPAGCSLDEFLFAPNDGVQPHLDAQWTLSFFKFPETAESRTLEDRCGKELMQALGTVFLRITADCPPGLADVFGKRSLQSGLPYFATETPLRNIVAALKNYFPELRVYSDANLSRGLPRFVASSRGRPPGRKITGRGTKRPATSRPKTTSAKKTR